MQYAHGTWVRLRQTRVFLARQETMRDYDNLLAESFFNQQMTYQCTDHIKTMVSSKRVGSFSQRNNPRIPLSHSCRLKERLGRSHTTFHHRKSSTERQPNLPSNGEKLCWTFVSSDKKLSSVCWDITVPPVAAVIGLLSRH